MSGLEWLEAASYLVTIVGLPLAIGVLSMIAGASGRATRRKSSCVWPTNTPTSCGW